MQTSSKVKPKRRGTRKRFQGKTLRCDNCPKRFTQKRPNQRFHSKDCKDQFHKNNAGFGKLRDRLPRFIKAFVRESFLELEAQIKELQQQMKSVMSNANKPDAQSPSV